VRNLFCDHGNLRNEADVEQNFARRLIEAIGYSDKAIRPKAALVELVVGNAEADQRHRPDFAMKVDGHIRWILEAKSPKERLENHFWQPHNYADAINNAYATTNPVRFFLLTNGLETKLYEVGKNQPMVTLAFHQFVEGNPDYCRLVEALQPIAFKKVILTSQETIRLSKPTIAEVTSVFARCHQQIYKSDKISQAKGFEEFVKLITLKLLSDKAVRDAYPGLLVERWFEYPADEVEFSLRWIAAQERHTSNPIDSILFQRFMKDVERDIAKQVRKRFFDEGDRINLKPETIRGVVKHLEGLYLFGIDADLNGRLFEDFLSATMRGKDLGQYFTPRTIVKLGVGLGDLETTNMVLDGCCGTGGFLIDALSDMWGKVNRNDSLSAAEKRRRRNAIADQQIYGIDFAKSPNLAKIARLNMYLHGDGGSRIFNIDGLDLKAVEDTTDSLEEQVEKTQFRELALAEKFDVVLTNPPFSKKYERANESDGRILEQYVTAARKPSAFAKMMFFEMYHHYLKPGGRLVSVIDDGFLSGGEYREFREHLRRLYAVKAVISLPGDAFQRSEARVKTSFIVLEKRLATDSISPNDDPAIFMYPCRYVGNDDPKRRRWMPGDDELCQKATDEVASAVREYLRFLNGDGNISYIVPADRAEDRLDVKHCLIDTDWRNAENLAPLSDFVTPKSFEGNDLINCPLHESPVQLLTVRYDGTGAPARVILPRTETKYAHLYRVRAGELVISNIAATYGSVTVVPPELDGLAVSKEYTVLQAKPGYDARVIWAILRSPEIRAELLLRTTGANRTRVRWSDIRSIAFPYPPLSAAKVFLDRMTKADAARSQAQEQSNAAISGLTEELFLDQERSHVILDAFKPPK